MANSRDPRMAKVYDKKSIYYHCVSLKKLLSQEEQTLMQPLEDSLRQQDKLRPPYGECHYCHDTGHWLGDCPEAQKLREQQMSTNKKPTYGQCYICGLENHWAQNCPGREEDLMNDKELIYSDDEDTKDCWSPSSYWRFIQTMKIMKSNSLQYLQRSNSLQCLQKSLQENVRVQTSLISVLREDVWILVQRRQLIHGKKPYGFIYSHLDPVQNW